MSFDKSCFWAKVDLTNCDLVNIHTTVETEATDIPSLFGYNLNLVKDFNYHLSGTRGVKGKGKNILWT